MKCSICGEEIREDDPWRYINGAGESTIGKIEIYGDKFMLCPDCTLYVYEAMERKRAEVLGYADWGIKKVK